MTMRGFVVLMAVCVVLFVSSLLVFLPGRREAVRVNISPKTQAMNLSCIWESKLDGFHLVVGEQGYGGRKTACGRVINGHFNTEGEPILANLAEMEQAKREPCGHCANVAYRFYSSMKLRPIHLNPRPGQTR